MKAIFCAPVNWGVKFFWSIFFIIFIRKLQNIWKLKKNVLRQLMEKDGGKKNVTTTKTFEI